MPTSGYSGYANHPWHHYLAGGPASLLDLVLPFLVIALFALLVAAGRWGADRAKSHSPARTRRKLGPRK